MQSFSSVIETIRRICNSRDRMSLHAPVFTGNERAYVLDAIDSTYVSSVGEYVSRFERMLREITGARHAVACVNGTAALQVALHLAGVEKGDLVLTQALSFVATANAVAHCGAEPVFLDVDSDTLGLSPVALRDFLQTQCESKAQGCMHKSTGRRIAACVPMHTFGLPCRIQELAELCVQWGIPLVEDSAEALGSYASGKHCGTFGLLGTLSFNGNKIVTTGGGGAILTDDAELGKKAKHLTTTAKQPHAWAFMHDSVAWNYRMPNLNAALGCAQLERLDEFVRIKRARVQAYTDMCLEAGWSIVPELPGSHSNYWLCAVLLADRAERDAFLEASNAAGVMTRPVWEPLHTLPMYTQCLHGDLGTTLSIADRLVNLPSGIGEQ